MHEGTYHMSNHSSVFYLRSNLLLFLHINISAELKANNFISLLFSFAGYISRGCSQPKEVDLTLKLLVSAAPIALMAIGLSIIYSYPINEEKRQANRKLLQDLR